MMSDLNITTVIAQMPNVQGQAAAQLAHPEVQQVFAAQLAQQALKQQSEQVQKIEPQEASQAVQDEDEQERSARNRHHPGERKRREGEAEEETEPASSSPWLGHLLNMKV